MGLAVFPGGGCPDVGLMGSERCDMIDLGHGVGSWLALAGCVTELVPAVLRRDSHGATAR